MVVTSVAEIEKRFQARFSEGEMIPLFNAAPGTRVPVVVHDSPNRLEMMTFGMTPFWAKKRLYLFNARAEGDHNSENARNYSGSLGILQKPAFRKPIRSKRCLIVCDAFIEGSQDEGLDKPWLVAMRNGERPFALAGLWDEWVNRETGEIVRSCAIITTVANELMVKIGHHRSPVILSRHQESDWLNPATPLSDVTAMLKPFPHNLLNAWPISPKIKNPRNNSPVFILPVASSVYPETELQFVEKLRLEGMGWSRARERKNNKGRLPFE